MSKQMKIPKYLLLNDILMLLLSGFATAWMYKHLKLKNTCMPDLTSLLPADIITTKTKSGDEAVEQKRKYFNTITSRDNIQAYNKTYHGYYGISI